jgi:enterochelin esterase-like enzyme
MERITHIPPTPTAIRIFARCCLTAVLFFVFSASLYSQSFSSFITALEKAPIEQRGTIADRYIAKLKSVPVIENDSLLHFIFYGAVDMVMVNGNLQHWNEPDTLNRIDCGAYAFFHRSYVVPPDARLDYLFIVNGRTILDPWNSRTTPSGFGPHSEVQMPKFVSSPYLVRSDSVPHGRIDSVVLLHYLNPPLSRYALDGRTMKVYLPPGYDSLSNLPVLYVHDGFEAIDFARLPTIIDNLIAAQRIVPIIAVFIPPSQRRNEYIFEQRDKFVAILSDELVPMIDRKYKTGPQPKKRGMMGISSGGHISLYTVFKRPDIFGNAGGQSSTITPWLSDLVRRQSARNILAPSMKIYIDCGIYDIKTYEPIYGNISFLDANREFSMFLSSLRIPHFYKEVNDGHEWASWRERMPEILMFFFGK